MACGLLQVPHYRDAPLHVEVTNARSQIQRAFSVEAGGKEDRGRRHRAAECPRRRACTGCGQHPRSASHRAIAAFHPLAADLQLPEEPRNDLRRRRVLRRTGQQADRRQIQHPRLRRRRPRAGVSGTRCRAARHGRALPHRDLLLRRQRLHHGFRNGAAVRAHHAPAERLDVSRRRHRHAECLLQGVWRHRASRPAIPARRWAAGFATR